MKRSWYMTKVEGGWTKIVTADTPRSRTSACWRGARASAPRLRPNYSSFYSWPPKRKQSMTKQTSGCRSCMPHRRIGELRIRETSLKSLDDGIGGAGGEKKHGSSTSPSTFPLPVVSMREAPYTPLSPIVTQSSTIVPGSMLIMVRNRGGRQAVFELHVPASANSYEPCPCVHGRPVDGEPGQRTRVLRKQEQEQEQEQEN